AASLVASDCADARRRDPAEFIAAGRTLENLRQPAPQPAAACAARTARVGMAAAAGLVLVLDRAGFVCAGLAFGAAVRSWWHRLSAGAVAALACARALRKSVAHGGPGVAQRRLPGRSIPPDARRRDAYADSAVHYAAALSAMGDGCRRGAAPGYQFPRRLPEHVAGAHARGCPGNFRLAVAAGRFAGGAAAAGRLVHLTGRCFLD